MWDFKLSDAFGAMVRTAPFIILRMLVYLGISLLYIIATGIGGAIGYGFTSFSGGQGGGAFYGGLFGFAGVSGLLYLGREYILYLVKAGHIAVLVLVHDGREMPGGRGQIDYASGMVKQKFAEASLLFALDQIIKGVLRTITGILNTVATILPIPGLNGLARLISAILRMSVTYVDEIILAHNFHVRSDNPWETSRQALVLYAQNYKVMIKNAAWLWLLMWALTFVIFFVLLGPVVALIALFPGDIGFLSIAVAFILAWSLKAALLEPVAIYALMQVYFATIEGQVPDREWELRLEQASDKFRQLRQRAEDAFSRSRPAADRAGQNPP
ncbi:hypothetical protein BMS3Bbin10_01669 [bacterium BMS3Bbin10]|nr:hypothetical protein BMS3Bbin10_01669 [bacterium BMS3Bbin10]HDL16924.1 hypothetical protein [Hyphomicrobiales bacterium]